MCIFVFIFISLIVKSDQLFFSWGELEEGNMHAAVRKKGKFLCNDDDEEEEMRNNVCRYCCYTKVNMYIYGEGTTM